MNRCRRFLLLSAAACLARRGRAFAPLAAASSSRGAAVVRRAAEPSEATSSAPEAAAAAAAIDSIDAASTVLRNWDAVYSRQFTGDADPSRAGPAEAATATAGTAAVAAPHRPALAGAVRRLAEAAVAQRAGDPARGRLMLGICAGSAARGVAALKAWVTALRLPRGLLHGMDEGGTPREITGGVFIKYNTGGVYTFAEVRRSGVGFDALWRPGDAMLENYDGLYRGVYFQVELEDGEFRQYLLPLDLFDEIPINE